MIKKIFYFLISLLFISSVMAETQICELNENDYPGGCNDASECNENCQDGTGWVCGGGKLGQCTRIVTVPTEDAVPEFTTIGIGAAIVLGGAAYLMLKNRK